MRLIDADSLLKGIEELKRSPWYKDCRGIVYRREAVDVVRSLCILKEPTIDAVPVVRCKDCKYVSKDNYPDGNRPTYACPLHDTSVTADWFCADGERRNDD